MRFDGKVALLTGAGSGMGRAITLKLAAEGAKILAVDIDAERLKETNDLAGGGLSTRVGDVSDPDECRSSVEACVGEFGKLDVLGNIPGIARSEHVPDVTVDQYRRMMGVNVDGYFFLAQAAIPHLLESEGNIVNIASNAGLMGQAYTVAYCMTKGAIVQLTKALAMEYAKAPLRVNAIAPGGVDTSLSRNFQIPEDLDFELMGRYTGFRSMGSPEDIAAMFALVASDEGRSIHGAILSVDRGITAG